MEKVGFEEELERSKKWHSFVICDSKGKRAGSFEKQKAWGWALKVVVFNKAIKVTHYTSVMSMKLSISS